MLLLLSVSSLLSVLLFGFALGLRHAADVDHVVAVGAIASREHSARKALLIGVTWGLGHALTVFFVGGAIVLFGITVPPRLGLGMEFAVAIMLIALGVLNFRAALPAIRGPSPDSPTGGQRPLQPGVPSGIWRSLGAGVVHGLAGSAAVALILVASIPDFSDVVLYLLVFGSGTMVGMVALTSIFAFPVAYAAHRFVRFQRSVMRVAGALSVACGLFLAYRVGVLEGLFSSPR